MLTGKTPVAEKVMLPENKGHFKCETLKAGRNGIHRPKKRAGL